MSLAAKVLNEHLKLFIDLSEVAQAAEVMIEKEDDEKDPVDMLLDEEARHIRRDYYNDYQRYQLMQVDKNRVILACRIIINDLLGKLYRYDYRFGYDLLLTEENSIERKLYNYGQAEWEDEEYEP